MKSRKWIIAAWSLLIGCPGASFLHAQMFTPAEQQAGLQFAIYGHGVAAADYNNDGLIDIYFVTRNPNNPKRRGSANMLFKNNGDGTFTDVAKEAGVEGVIDTTRNLADRVSLNYGASWGDFDNDGDVDLYITNKGVDELYENLGNGTFKDISHSSGIDATLRESTTAVWWDYDRDGDLDLYLGSYGTFGSIPSSANVLYRNNGDKTFTDVTEHSGLGDISYTFTPLVVDANFDGWPDIYNVNDFGDNFFYLNNGDGTFREATQEYGLVNDGHGMGATLGDYNNDGRFDIYFTNIADEVGLEWSPLLRHESSGKFTDVSAQSGTGITNWAWGCEFFDYDLDGDLDIYVVNGFNGNDFTNRLYRNNNDGTFADISAASGTDSPLEARGLCVADFNNDGCLDLFVSNWRNPAQLYMNAMHEGNYLRIKLVGTQSNRDAYGATVQVQAGGKSYYRPNDGVEYLGQSKLPIHFGLADANKADRIVVNWPSGQTQEFLDVQANQTVTIIEGQGIVTDINTAPGSQPQDFRLLANYPNPVRRFTKFQFQTPFAGQIRIDVYDILGREVAVATNRYFAAGIHSVSWNPVDLNGRPLPAGEYFVKMSSKNHVNRKKLVVVK